MKLIPGITLVPVLHGQTAFGTYVRNLCNSEKFDCIAVDLPEPFIEQLYDAVTKLPFISAVTATRSIETTSPVYYIPTDPCDATIEGVRQAQQNHIPCHCIGYPELFKYQPLPPLPDAHAGNDDRAAIRCRRLGQPYLGGAGQRRRRAGQRPGATPTRRAGPCCL